eukprot:UN19545
MLEMEKELNKKLPEIEQTAKREVDRIREWEVIYYQRQKSMEKILNNIENTELLQDQKRTYGID